MSLTTKQLFYLAAGVYLIAAVFSVGNHHPDEHFQILEFASYKLGIATESNLAWEYHFQMRPALQPAIVVVIYRFLDALGLANPFFVAFVLRLLSAVFSLYVIWELVKVYRDRLKSPLAQNWFVVLSLFLWFAVYDHVRFSSENWSANFFYLGFAWLMNQKNKQLYWYILAGFLFGLAFVTRYQMAFMILGFGLWLWLQRKDAFGKLAVMALAFFAMVGVGILIDKWFYGNWTLTTWNYLKMNLIEGRASNFGEAPWYFYITETIRNAVPPFSILYVVPFLWVIVKRPRSAITWTVVPFLLVHFWIAHKELRFMFSLLGFLPVAMAMFFDDLFLRYGTGWVEGNVWARWFKKLFWWSNVALVIYVMFSAANTDVLQKRALYNAVKRPSVVFVNDFDALEWTFYYPKYPVEFKLIDVEGPPRPVPGKDVFVITSDKALVKQYKQHEQLIYSSFPEIARHFNINDWISRTTWFYIFKL